MRALNRATLARQLLLERAELSPAAAVARLVGMQMQEEPPVHIGLWSRLAGITRPAVQAAFDDRTLVRGTAMRGTLYAFAAEDFAWVRPTIGPALASSAATSMKKGASADEIAAAIDVLRARLADGPLTAEDMRDAIAALEPVGEVRSIAYAARMALPLIQTPGGGTWGFAAKTPYVLAESWLDRPLAEPDIPRLIRRYLAAHGPATAADIGAWAGLPSPAALLKGMAGELRVYALEGSTALLYDVPDGPLPDEETAAPPRLLPAFDNLLLSHKDRTRVVTDDHRARLYQKGNLRILPAILVDGEAAGTWRIEKKRREATLTLLPFVPIAKPDAAALTEEAEALARFLEPTATAWAVTFRDE